jgi:hypothetical protein
VAAGSGSSSWCSLARSSSVRVTCRVSCWAGWAGWQTHDTSEPDPETHGAGLERAGRAGDGSEAGLRGGVQHWHPAGMGETQQLSPGPLGAAEASTTPNTSPAIATRATSSVRWVLRRRDMPRAPGNEQDCNPLQVLHEIGQLQGGTEPRCPISPRLSTFAYRLGCGDIRNPIRHLDACVVMTARRSGNSGSSRKGEMAEAKLRAHGSGTTGGAESARRDRVPHRAHRGRP